MYPSHYLEWWHNGSWKRIGWTARNPQSTERLRQHAAEMARDNPGSYRIVLNGLRVGDDVFVIEAWETVHEGEPSA